MNKPRAATANRERKPRAKPVDKMPPAPAKAVSSEATDIVSFARAMASVPMTVRWGDLDAFNHVNNATFLVYAQEARLAWLAQVDGVWFDASMMPVVAAAQINFRRQLAWPAQLIIELTATRLGTSSVTIAHRIIDASDHARVYADGDVVMVWVDPDSGRPVTLPSVIRAACQLPSSAAGLPESAATTSK